MLSAAVAGYFVASCMATLKHELLHIDKHDKGGEGMEYRAWCEKLSGMKKQLGAAREELHSKQQLMCTCKGRRHHWSCMWRS